MLLKENLNLYFLQTTNFPKSFVANYFHKLRFLDVFTIKYTKYSIYYC